MSDFDYTYAVAYINSLKNKFLKESDFEFLSSLDDSSAVINALKARGFSFDLEKLTCEILKLSPNKEAINVFFYRNDFHNLKVFLKHKDKKYEDLRKYLIFPGVYDAEKMFTSLKQNNFNLLPRYLKHAADSALNKMKHNSYQLWQVFIDKFSMDFSLKKATETGIDFFRELIMLENTLSDIKIAYRCARNNKDEDFLNTALSEEMLISRKALIKSAIAGENELLKFLSSTKFKEAENYLNEGFENYCSDKIRNCFKKYQYTFFGPVPLIFFLYEKEREMEKVRLIISHKE